MADYILVGFMGAGKTTISQQLAMELALDYHDVDQLITEEIMMSISSYFKTVGEEKFRQKEHQTLTDLLSQPGILSTGGGIVLREDNRELLKASRRVVYLTAKPSVIIQRIRQDQTSIRPLASEKSEREITALFKSREALYKEVATWTVETSNLTPAEVVTEIMRLGGNLS